MSLKGLLMWRVYRVLLCCGVCMSCQGVMAQQAISNPLVRPAGLGAGGAPQAGASGTAAQKPEAQNAAVQSSASPDIRDKAASRLSQEDFNLKQQALNASAIPAPLGSLFNQMMVSAVVGGSVVLRRAEAVAALGGQQAAQAGTAGNGGQSNGAGGGSRGGVGGAVVTSSVLRLRVGQPTNLNGYVLRARVDGMDVFVDWKNEQGAWVGVFFGALESGGVIALTPAKDALEKVDNSSFDYLKPQVSNRVSGNGAVGTNAQGGAPNGSGLGSTGSSGTGSASSF